MKKISKICKEKIFKVTNKQTDKHRSIWQLIYEHVLPKLSKNQTLTLRHTAVIEYILNLGNSVVLKAESVLPFAFALSPFDFHF